jgi:hypothetical protein
VKKSKYIRGVKVSVTPMKPEMTLDIERKKAKANTPE